MSQRLLLASVVLLSLLCGSCGGGSDAPPADTAPGEDSSAGEDVRIATDIGAVDSDRQDTAADIAPDLPPPPSPWLRPWKCTAMVTTDTESSHGENPLDEFALFVTEDPTGDLVLQIDHYLYEACLMTWAVDGDAATLAPLDCADTQFPPNEYAFETGTATVGDATLSVELGGTKLHGRSGTLYTLGMTLDCVGCPYEPCGLACEWGVCCGGEGAPCCDAKDACAGDLECIDGACAEPGPIPCPSNACEDNGFGSGWHCDGDIQHRCTTLPSGCFGPILSNTQDCGPGGCDPATGTCGGCDMGHDCAGFPEGAHVCVGNGKAKTCGTVDGCPGFTGTVTCSNTCMVGVGCCGGAAEPCCAAMGNPCQDGLSCQDDVCR